MQHPLQSAEPFLHLSPKIQKHPFIYPPYPQFTVCNLQNSVQFHHTVRHLGNCSYSWVNYYNPSNIFITTTIRIANIVHTPNILASVRKKSSCVIAYIRSTAIAAATPATTILNNILSDSITKAIIITITTTIPRKIFIRKTPIIKNSYSLPTHEVSSCRHSFLDDEDSSPAWVFPATRTWFDAHRTMYTYILFV